MRLAKLAFVAMAAVPALAQHDISKVDPAPPDSAIATPTPTGRRMKKYESPDLDGAQQALGSQLIEGRLRKPLVDFIIFESKVVQRLSLFEAGLVVVDMTGGTTIRKKMILPKHALDIYLTAITPARLEAIAERSLAPPEPQRRGLLRVYREDGTFVERAFHPGRVLSKNFGDQITPLRDLLRAVSEDRTVTSTVAGYEPKPGDVLVADDQTAWRVVRVVEKGNVVELKCLDTPTTIYVAKHDLHLYFIGRKGD